MKLSFYSKSSVCAGLIIIATLIIEISTGINYVIFPVSIKALVNSNSLVGIAMSFEIISIIIFCNIINNILNFLGLVKSIVISSLIRSLALLLVQYINSYEIWIVTIFIYGFVTNILRLSLQTWLNLLSFRKIKGLVLGVYSSALSLGVALGPLVLTQINANREFQIIFNSILSILAILIIFPLLKSTPKIDVKNKNRFIFILNNSKIIMISALVGGVIFFGLPSFLTLYGIESGLNENEASFLLTAFMLGSVLLGILISTLSSYIKKRHLIIFCVFNSLICSVLLPITIYNFSLSLLLLFFWGGNSGGLFAIGLSIIGSTFRTEDQISANMTYSIMDSGGGLIGLCFIGAAMDLIGSEGLTYIIVTSSISFFIYVLSKNKFR